MILSQKKMLHGQKNLLQKTARKFQKSTKTYEPRLHHCKPLHIISLPAALCYTKNNAVFQNPNTLYTKILGLLFPVEGRCLQLLGSGKWYVPNGILS